MRMFICMLLFVLVTGVTFGEEYGAGDPLLVTVDDGPNAYTRPILDELNKRKILCVFFVTGNSHRFNSRIDVLRDIIQGDHVIGNHTKSHDLGVLRYSGYSVVSNEVRFVQDYFLDKFGYKITLFRPPYGVRRESILPVVLSNLGLRNMMWNVDVHVDGNSVVIETAYVRRGTTRNCLLHSNRMIANHIVDILDALERDYWVIKMKGGAL